MPSKFFFGDRVKSLALGEIPPSAAVLTDSSVEHLPVLKSPRKTDTGPSPRPPDLATLRVPGFVRELTAADLASILHTQFPQLPALGVAEAVLAGLPDTARTDMLDALTGYGVPDPDAQGAVNILYPARVTIHGNQPWQTTGVNVTGAQRTSIACTGTWTANPATGSYGPAGNPRSVAPPGYALRGAAEGAMVGRVGSNPPFLVGSDAVVPAGQSGSLFLSINDDLDGRYGMGLADNTGALLAVITTRAAPS